VKNSIYDGIDLLPEDLQGWNGNSKIFGDLIQKIKPNIIVEVGSWKGQSAINMAKVVRGLSLNCKIFCIDTWLGSIEFITTMKDTPERNLLHKNGYPQVYFQFLSNVVHNNYEDIIIPIPNTSVNGAKFLQFNKICPDLIYLDASHEEDEVYQDMTNYFTILNSGGIIFGDDFSENWHGLKTSVTRFANERHLQLEIIENNYWVLNK
jgi:hypothetical protein